MFKNEIVINQMQLGYLDKIVADLPADQHFEPAPGHGHSPAWILGHLALVGEMGQMLLGGELTHPRWAPLFSPGSPPTVKASESLAPEVLTPALHEAYTGLQRLAAEASPDVLARPHSVEVLQGTPIETVEHCTAVLLTNHFAFHLSQLSSCRRAAGKPALF